MQLLHCIGLIDRVFPFVHLIKPGTRDDTRILSCGGLGIQPGYRSSFCHWTPLLLACSPLLSLERSVHQSFAKTHPVPAAGPSGTFRSVRSAIVALLVLPSGPSPPVPARARS